MTSGVQLDFDQVPDTRPRSRRPLDEAWGLFVDANPGIVDEMARTATQLDDLGLRVSINRIFEELRERIHTVGDTYRLNNSFRAFAARDIMRQHPALDGLFETRTSKADR